ncbi:BTB/POZ domain-containing family protein [Dorcoceras hygrometricum]|uniref:BTB/POZ domain-containing family protein n=1 Tax=Dorcoceras hygrometricum TaxID=472368 RepID=A0A2Z7CDF6_9LAMI|nr:BTB/POZ domain-containing family protein [Dorcoceras hygrometricum]
MASSLISNSHHIDFESVFGLDDAVYRSLSPISPEVDSFENDLRFALGPVIFSSVEQEERLYFVQSPESPPAASPHQESSSSSTDVSLHFDSADIPVHDQAATQASAPFDFSMFTDAVEDLRSSLAQRILDSNCEILSKVNAVELGVRGDLLKLEVMLRQSLENACRVLERQGTTQATQINDLKKGLMAPVGTIFQDLFDIKKKQREQDAKLIALDGQISAIRSEQLDFQTKIAADILSLSTQVGDIADYLRGGVAKKGEIGSSSRPSTVRTQTFPPKRRERRLSRSGAYKRRRG